MAPAIRCNAPKARCRRARSCAGASMRWRARRRSDSSCAGFIGAFSIFRLTNPDRSDINFASLKFRPAVLDRPGFSLSGGAAVTASELPQRSLVQLLHALGRTRWDAGIAALGDAEVQELLRDWRFWARPNQLPPPGAWRVWLLLAGR